MLSKDKRRNGRRKDNIIEDRTGEKTNKRTQ